MTLNPIHLVVMPFLLGKTSVATGLPFKGIPVQAVLNLQVLILPARLDILGTMQNTDGLLGLHNGGERVQCLTVVYCFE